MKSNLVECEICKTQIPESEMIPLCLYEEDIGVCVECEGL